MAKVYKNSVKIENLDPEVCRAMGGIVEEDGSCRIKIVVDESNPKKISVEPLERDELID